jgi:hypothetical protein
MLLPQSCADRKGRVRRDARAREGALQAPQPLAALRRSRKANAQSPSNPMPNHPTDSAT